MEEDKILVREDLSKFLLIGGIPPVSLLARGNVELSLILYNNEFKTYEQNKRRQDKG